MAITYIEKGLGMHAAIAAAGIQFANRNGTWVTSDEAGAQAIIDSYDNLPDLKASRVQGIKAEGLIRINLLFPAITSVDEIEFYAEFWQSIKTTSRQATVKFQKIIDIYSAAKAGITAVNGAASAAAVAAVAVVWP